MNGLIIDAEIRNCIPPKWFKADEFSPLSVGEQFYNSRVQYVLQGQYRWTEDYYLEQLQSLNNDCVNPVDKTHYSYAKGWEDYSGMQVACVGVRDCLTRQNHVFLGDENGLEELQKLIDSRDFVIGYNNVRFDNNLLEAAGVKIKSSFDVLRALWKNSGLNPDEFTANHKGYGLEQVSIINRIGKKDGSGIMAPMLWQQGRIEELTRYCQHDVELLRMVLYKAIMGELLHPISGNLVRLEILPE